MMPKNFSIPMLESIKKSQKLLRNRDLISDLFNSDYYLNLYPDVAESGHDPIEHFLKHGGAEGRRPNEVFDSAFYLERHEDVAKAGINPLVHFVEFGWRELRNPSADFDTGWYWVVHMGASFAQGDPLRHYLTQGKSSRLTTKPHAPLSASETREIEDSVNNILKRQNILPETCATIGDFLVSRSLWPQAELVYRALAGLRWDDAAVHERLASILATQGNWWQQIEELTTAIKLAGGRADWFYRLGIAQQAMGRWQEAAESYENSLALAPSYADAHYRRGFVLEKLERETSQECYGQAIASSGNKDAARFGVGVFHQAEGYWDEAGHAYAQQLKKQPLDAPLHYRLGMAMDRCYRWSDAAKHYRTAIALDPNVPSWHYRLGFALERMRQWQEAADAYARAFRLSPEPRPYWKYRAAYALMQAGAYQAACAAFLDMHPAWRADGSGDSSNAVSGTFAAIAIPLIQDALAKDYTHADWHYELGRQYERALEWDKAASSYSAAIDRSDTHRPTWFFRLGLALTEAGRFQDACQAFAQLRILQRPYGVPEKAFNQNPDQKLTTSYVEFSECLPVRENVILYESFNGNAITCNPLAIFKRIVDDPDFADYLHIWVLNDKARIPEELRTKQNVIFISRASHGYLRHIATAEYLINNSGFPPYFIRREGQKYLATWHGTPLKTLGKEQKYKFYDHKRTQRNFLQSTHIISPNEFTTGILLDSYDIRPIYSGKILESGYPRIDLTLNTTMAERATLKQRLGIPEGKPVVLYAPTWRGTLDDVQFDTQRLENDLNALRQQNCHVLFRGHSLLERVLENDDSACNVVPADIDSNALLSIVDILITDYSSIFFDFMATGRQILYYIYDLEEYEAERGLYFDMESMPGYKCRSIEELCTALSHALSGETLDQRHYHASQKRFNHHDDGSATNRVVDFFFRDSRKNILTISREEKPCALIYAGSFSPNGITTSFINLVNNLDGGKIDLVLAISPNNLERSEDRLSLFRELSSEIYTVPRYGNIPMTIEERWLRARQEAQPFSLGEEGKAILRNAYQREFVRIFGKSRFDSVVSFSGYDAFWSSVLIKNNFEFKKVIYLHNDMYSEFVQKNPSLNRMFELYREADCLASVSCEMSITNKTKLSDRFGIPPNKFTHIENMIDLSKIIDSSNQEIDADLLPFFNGKKTFLTMGRMSVEKDHGKLLRAFKGIINIHPDARLVILGDGPLRHELEMLIESLNLKKFVFLAGQRSNPFPALKACDCFVLPSNHEGQPMVLLEAMTLNKPIVATNIDGNRGVLADRGGCLVDNSAEGLAEGMICFLKGEVAPCLFDAEQYQTQALRQFENVILKKDGSTEASSPSLIQSRSG